MPNDLGAPDGKARVLPAKTLPFRHLLKQSIAAHSPFLLLIAGYAVCLGGLVILVPDMSARVAPGVVLPVFFVIALVSALLLVAYLFIGMAIHERPERPALRLLSKTGSVIRDGETWAKGLPMYFCICLFMVIFGHVKASITLIQPFSWDETFDRWDLAMHFGRRPWEWLHPILGHPPVTFVINFNYNLWALILFGFWMHYGLLAKPGEERTRYFLSFMLTWMIGGSLFAVLLSSAGPCYYGEGGLGISPDPYAGLMAYLNAANESVPVWALSVHETLWKTVGYPMPFGGVSAMPSMHNASALLFVMASRGFPRWMRWLLIVHCGLVYLGSIHLAWHYAVDAYLAWAITLAVWYAVGPLSRWWESRPAALAFRLTLESRRRA